MNTHTNMAAGVELPTNAMVRLNIRISTANAAQRWQCCNAPEIHTYMVH